MEKDVRPHKLVVPAPRAVRRALAPDGIRAEMVLTRLDGSPLTETQARLAKAVLALLDAEQELSFATSLDKTPLPATERKSRR